MKRNEPNQPVEQEKTAEVSAQKGPELFTPIRQPGMPVGQRLVAMQQSAEASAPSPSPVVPAEPPAPPEEPEPSAEAAQAASPEPVRAVIPPQQSGQPVIDPQIFEGLSEEEVAEQIRLDHVNHPFTAPTRSIRQIVRDNIVTPFNLLNFVLAGLVVLAAMSELKLLLNLTFMGVVLSNIVIGIFQEVRAKKTIDRLAILTEPHVKVIRGSQEQTISVHELVVGDLMVLEAGNQISVDAHFITGQGFEVDESLLTGESDHILKKTGDDLLSGSVVMAGTGYAIVENVGTQTFAARISMEAKREVKKHSLIMDSLNKIIKILTLVMIPVGIALFISSYSKASEGGLPTTLVTVVAALIGMIPEGLMLLTSIAFAVGVINLGRKKMLVQTLPSIETLARVDTICLDKTGTLTNGQMDVKQLHLFDPQQPGRLITSDPLADPEVQNLRSRLEGRIAAMVEAQKSSNATQDALRAYFTRPSSDPITRVIPFSSKRKWSGVEFADGSSLIMGAPELILGERFALISPSVNALASQGYRVLLIATSDQPFRGEGLLPDQLRAAACISLVDQLRKNVNETIEYFYEQDVNVKIISGDNPHTVAAVARSAGVRQADKWIDMSQVEDGTDLTHVVETYTLFGRVTPFQKRQLLNALQKNGHVVSMTGDGVNDVLALKDADCSVAMADGSDAARSAADLVLLDNNIASMVDAVYEGRRVINNIERVASLFLIKTVYSCLLSFIYIFLPFVYPLLPIQNSLISAMTIGLPSFVLALKPNKERVRGNFLRNVLTRSVPGGLAAAIMVVLSQVCGYLLHFSYIQSSTIAVLILGFVGLLVLHQVSQPMDPVRKLLFFGCTTGLLAAIIFLPKLFFLSNIISPLFWIYLPFLITTGWLYSAFRNYGRIRAAKRQQKKLKRLNKKQARQRDQARQVVHNRYRIKRNRI